MSVDLTHLLVDIEDQRHYNSCVGQAISTYVEAVWKRATGESLEFSPAFIWYQCKIGKGNTGASFSGGFDALVHYGICEERYMPYDKYVVDTPPSAEAIANAKMYKAKSWKPLNGADEIKAWLDKGFPVVGAFDFFPGQSMRHAMCVFGYDDKGFLIVNSWGKSWDEDGKFVMPYAEFDAKLRSAIVVDKFYIGFWAAMKRKFKSLVSWYKLYR